MNRSQTALEVRRIAGHRLNPIKVAKHLREDLDDSGLPVTISAAQIKVAKHLREDLDAALEKHASLTSNVIKVAKHLREDLDGWPCQPADLANKGSQAPT